MAGLTPMLHLVIDEPTGAQHCRIRTSRFQERSVVIIMDVFTGQSPAARIGLSVIALLAGYVLWCSFTSPLNKYPGPFLASKSHGKDNLQREDI
jgi:hypothetical protein